MDDPAYLAIQQLEQDRLRFYPYVPASLFVFVGTPVIGVGALALRVSSMPLPVP